MKVTLTIDLASLDDAKRRAFFTLLDAQVEKAEEADPAPPREEEKAIALETLQGLAAALLENGRKATLVKILEKVGTPSLSKTPKAKYAELYALLEEEASAL